MRIFLCKTWIGAAALAAASAASGTPLLIQFAGGGPELVAANLVTQGFVFSPSCHYDLTGAPGFLGFDRSGCNDPQFVNANYLGPDPAAPPLLPAYAYLYVAREGGGAFSLQGMQLSAMFPGGPGFEVESSAGGHELLDGNDAADQVFAGAAWSQLDWLLFRTASGSAVGFRSLQVEVGGTGPAIPEPSHLGWLGLALLAGQRVARAAPGRARAAGSAAS